MVTTIIGPTLQMGQLRLRLGEKKAGDLGILQISKDRHRRLHLLAIGGPWASFCPLCA